MTLHHIFCSFWIHVYVTTSLYTFVVDGLVGRVPVKRHRHWHWHRLGCNDDLPASSPPALSVTCACVLVLWSAVTTHSACGHALFVGLESSGACILTRQARVPCRWHLLNAQAQPRHRLALAGLTSKKDLTVRAFFQLFLGRTHPTRIVGRE